MIEFNDKSYGKKVLLMGGGLDSVAYLILMVNQGLDFEVVTVNYGQHPAIGEIEAALYFADKYKLEYTTISDKVILKYQKGRCSLFTGDSNDPAYVNGRNLSLIMLALKRGQDIYLGFTNPGYQPFPDADDTFLVDTNKMLARMFNYPVRVQAPYLNVPRIELLKLAYKLDQDLFKYSFTCWTPKVVKDDSDVIEKQIECGTCKHCVLKQKAQEICESSN